MIGSAAALAAMGGAKAADLPAAKAAPVEYVRVCSTYGSGFFYVPGSDSCLPSLAAFVPITSTPSRPIASRI